MDWIEKLTRHKEPMPHIASADIEKHAPPEDFESLSNWMRGQTIPVLDDGTTGVYAWDFDRWVRWKKHQERIIKYGGNSDKDES
jgi:hypothetical protein